MDEKDGNREEAIGTALIDYQGALYGFLYVQLGNRDAANEVLQETNHYILKNSGRLDDVVHFKPWAKSMAVYQLKRYRMEKTRENAAVLFDSETADRVAETLADGSERDEDAEIAIDRLTVCLAKLPPKKRNLVRRHYWQNESLDAIAASSSSTKSAVAVALHRIRQQLGDCIRRLLCRSADGSDVVPSPQETQDALLLASCFDADHSLFPDFAERVRQDSSFRREWVADGALQAALSFNRAAFAIDLGLMEPEPVRPRFLKKTMRKCLLAASVALLASAIGVAALLRRGSPTVAPMSVVVAKKCRAPAAAESRPPLPAAGKPAPKVAAVVPPPAKPKPVVVTKNQTLAVAKPQKQKEKEKPMNLASIPSTTIRTAAAAIAISATAPKAAPAENISNVPVVSNVTFRQPFGERTLQIGYTLSNGPGIVTVDVTTNGVSIGDANMTFLKGEVNKVVQNGAHTVLWDTKRAWPNHTNEQARAVVTVWATNCPPDYMVVDLADGTNIEYYTSAEALPAGGLTNAIYRNTRLVMRKIAAAGVPWSMGARGELLADDASETPHSVTLGNDYYIGVFEFTQGQWANIKKGDWPSYWNNISDAPGRPVEQRTYNMIRGSIASSFYPAAPASDSFLGLLRAKTGLAFDLPGEAQWEYACRAGNYEGKWGDGSAILVKDASTDANLDLLGRYMGDGGGLWSGTAYTNASQKCTAQHATAIVGSYRPNSWGLYDMHGNVWEWCLDLYTNDITALGGAVNTNPASGTNRVKRGGGWGSPAMPCRSAYRLAYDPSIGYDNTGFRVVLALGL